MKDETRKLLAQIGISAPAKVQAEPQAGQAGKAPAQKLTYADYAQRVWGPQGQVQPWAERPAHEVIDAALPQGGDIAKNLNALGSAARSLVTRAMGKSSPAPPDRGQVEAPRAPGMDPAEFIRMAQTAARRPSPGAPGPRARGLEPGE